MLSNAGYALAVNFTSALGDQLFHRLALGVGVLRLNGYRGGGDAGESDTHELGSNIERMSIVASTAVDLPAEYCISLQRVHVIIRMGKRNHNTGPPLGFKKLESSQLKSRKARSTVTKCHLWAGQLCYNCTRIQRMCPA